MQAARAAYFTIPKDCEFTAADYGFDLVEVWPENWPAVLFFLRLQTQWRVAPMGGLLGLDYSAVYPLLDRSFTDPDDWNEMFEDIRAMESAAIDQTRQGQ